MAWTRRDVKETSCGMWFLLPNIIGFLIFTLLPLAFSIFLAFSNWDLRQHNMFRQAPLDVVGLDNFTRLLRDHDFWRFLGNTLFLMMNIPLCVAGSLGAAVLLSQELRPKGQGSQRRMIAVIVALGMIYAVSVVVLLLLGMKITGTIVLIGGVGCLILAGGAIGGHTVYRTLFFTPHFTAGVATFILWKKLYNTETGPINSALRPALDVLTGIVQSLPEWVLRAGAPLAALLIFLLVLRGFTWLRQWWREGDLGWPGVAAGAVLLLIPVIAAQGWMAVGWPARALLAMVSIAILVMARSMRSGSHFRAPYPSYGLGTALMLCFVGMVLGMILLGLGNVACHLPAMASDGLKPPGWIADYHWAKPSLMIIALWAAIGSNNMLLYLAGLSNVSPSLYEAADIDGASGFQRFWHVTWPQLVPITFFIVIMSFIQGLQGGFEMARSMTQGGPAGATTTLSYFIYIQGFQTGRLGFASAIAWTLFALVFTATLINWRFGNRYVND